MNFRIAEILLRTGFTHKIISCYTADLYEITFVL